LRKKTKSPGRPKASRKAAAKPRPRGRPPKSKKKEHKPSSEIKRPRGRPRKVVSQEAPVVRRGRGRPPGKKKLAAASSNGSSRENHEGIGNSNGDLFPALGATTQVRIRELLKLAKEQGYLTFDDLNEALPPDLTDADELDLILIRLR
jgi:RNA polymerase primary sigma factor